MGVEATALALTLALNPALTLALTLTLSDSLPALGIVFREWSGVGDRVRVQP